MSHTRKVVGMVLVGCMLLIVSPADARAPASRQSQQHMSLSMHGPTPDPRPGHLGQCVSTGFLLECRRLLGGSSLELFGAVGRGPDQPVEHGLSRPSLGRIGARLSLTPQLSLSGGYTRNHDQRTELAGAAVELRFP